MKKNLKKLLSVALVAFTLFNLPCIDVFAAEDVQTIEENVVELDAEIVDLVGDPDISVYATTFYDTSITITFSADGMLVEIATFMNKTASVVGVKDIRIQKKGLFGWSTVATSNGGESYNVTGVGCTVLYPDAVKGETYRVLCTHYGNVDEYRELANDSGAVKCTY